MTDQNNSIANMVSQICNQIQSIFSRATAEQSALDVMVEEIAGAAGRKGRVFVHGMGREGLMLKALCMCLAHLGLFTHCVGDMTTPPVSFLDLLVTSARSDGFSTIDAISC
ncbi:hypothetical protein NE237_025187 [Protea cynaroides]|uniref:SIS domain-containing protein n=1 Tax=Protea cynaroides TaxID=273540 RepID=A0A9Q0H3Q2_9MAGN|nr:hypothetical protein NE237_025187 [Protea cynaroides]